jgi:hypothetical protein
MNAGMLVITQTTFWRAWQANPAYSVAALQRAQAAEIRLNLRGVLHIAADLASGNWGRQPPCRLSGQRPASPAADLPTQCIFPVARPMACRAATPSPYCPTSGKILLGS